MRAPLLLLPLVLAGCAVHHEALLPAVAGADAGWIAAAPDQAEPAGWWAGLGDPALGALIARALAANPDIAEAAAKLRSARAGVEAARGRALPQVNASASATTNAQSANGMIPFGRLPGVTRTYDLFDGGFDASWEIDLWGARAATIRAARARDALAAAQADGVRLALVAEVARNYVALRAAEARRANLEAQVAALGQLAGLQQARRAAGEAAQDDPLAARQRLEAARQALAGAEADGAAARFALALLAGAPPEALDLAAGPIPAAPVQALVGLRSAVLRRRPDVRAAVADLAAARADADAAHAALFPSLSLTGSLGQQARNASDITAGTSLRYGFGPSLHWPVFAAGQLRAQARGSRALADAAAARYEKAVLSALSDSETAANRLARAQAASAAASAAAQAAGAAHTLAERRFAAGEDSRLLLIEAQVAALSAQSAQDAARAAEASAYVALGKALGAS